MINLNFTNNGLETPTFEDIYNDFVSKIKEVMGDDFYLDAESPDAQYLNMLALAQYDTCLVMQKAIQSFYPSTAQGVNLDRICDFQSIQRFQPTKSTCEVTVLGKPDTDLSNMILEDVNGEMWNVLSGKISAIGETVVTATSVNDAVYAGIKEITNIVDAPQDVEKVYNKVPCIQGKKAETDAELRIRRANSVLTSSAGTTESVFGALINLEGVNNLNVISTLDNNTVNGLPGKSLIVSILGGDDKKIAEIISAKKAPGCGLAGTTEVVLQKGAFEETIRFYRPEYVECKISITLTPLVNYANFYKEQISELVKEYVSTLKIGEYVYLGKLFQLCYSTIKEGMPFNVANITMEILREGKFVEVTNNISVSPVDLLTFAADGLTVSDGETTGTDPNPDPEQPDIPGVDTNSGLHVLDSSLGYVDSKGAVPITENKVILAKETGYTGE